MCFVEVIDTAGQGVYRCDPLHRPRLIIICSHRGVCDTPRSMGQVGRYFPLHPPSRCESLHREGQGFILVYSIASRATFERLDVFRQAMLKVKRQKPVFMLVGNKCDKQFEREVSREEGAALARQFGCEFLETSAKTAHNVERLFMNLVRLLRSTKQQEQGVPGTVRSSKEKEKRKCLIM
ncbi:P-loop containing nucleoside triphosphate hydrolase protein [Trametes elegans]|nr:P-loop containing nucleoside triphosphate hydrolase protein [Trametes elegans]